MIHFDVSIYPDSDEDDYKEYVLAYVKPTRIIRFKLRSGWIKVNRPDILALPDELLHAVLVQPS